MSYQSKQEENRRLKKLYRKTSHGYGRGAYYSETKQRIIRYWNPSRFGYWCRLGNRKFRHKHGEVAGKGREYIKIGGSAWYSVW